MDDLKLLHNTRCDRMIEIEFDLRVAHFYPEGQQVSRSALEDWRRDLNAWAFAAGFPAERTLEQTSDWDVELGQRLLEDTAALPERLHPYVWTWLATRLLPHFVVYRWGWPDLKDGEVPALATPWSRFGPTDKNGLRLAMLRVMTYGAEVARRATEQEFQSIQYRPAYGLDRRVARVVLETLVTAAADPRSNYGKNGGNRSKDGNFVCMELRLLNSMQPLCFKSDTEVSEVVSAVIDRLPELRSADRSFDVEVDA
jgi:hypothetical protein